MNEVSPITESSASPAAPEPAVDIFATAQGGPLPTPPRKLEDELSAMEAVRELLFGRRMADLQQQLQTTKETWHGELVRLEAHRQLQQTELLATARAELDGLQTRSFQEFEVLGNALGESRTSQNTRTQELAQQLQRLAEAQASTEAAMKEHFKALEARLDREVAALQLQLANMQQNVPTSDELAGVFRQMADRMKAGLADTPTLRQLRSADLALTS